MIDKFYYFLYLLYIGLVIFCLYLLASINNFNLIIVLGVFIAYALFSMISIGKDDINNFYMYEYVDNYDDDDVKNLENFILISKRMLIFTITFAMFYFNLFNILLIICIFDFIIKLTLDTSLLEFFYKRRIKIY